MIESIINCDMPVATKECYSDTLIGQLRRKKQRAETDLKLATEALEALEKNPEVAKILELVSKAR